MKLRSRTPFFGDDEDRALLGEHGPQLELVASMGDGSEDDRTSPFLPEVEARELIETTFAEFRRDALGVAAAPRTKPHPDYCEKGTELPLGFIPHRGENRTQRRAAVANFSHPEADRRELLKQRQRQRRGKLDPELRRLQRRKAEQR